MKKMIFLEVFGEAILKTGFPASILSIVLAFLTFYNFDSATQIPLGDVLLWLSIALFVLWIFLASTWTLIKKLEEGYAKLPKVDASYGPGTHFSGADATLIVPDHAYLENNTTIAIYESSGREDLIGLGYVEKHRNDGCIEVVSHSLVSSQENSIWDSIRKGEKKILNNIILKLSVPWQHISLNYNDQENAEIQSLIEESSSLTEDEGVKV